MIALQNYSLPIGVYQPVQVPVQTPLPSPGISVASLPVTKKDEVIEAGVSTTDLLSPVGLIVIGGLLLMFALRKR